MGDVQALRTSRWFHTAALIIAALLMAGVWFLWRIFVATAPGQQLEQVAFDGADYGRTHLWVFGQPLLEAVSAVYVVVALAVTVIITLFRRRWSLAVQVIVLIGGANVSTQVIKHLLLDRPDFGIPWNYGNSLPSGHTTVAASASMALLIAVPRRFRPIVALLGAVYTATMGVSTLVGNWHRASDVVAGVLVAGAWCALVSAFPGRTARDQHEVHSAPWTIAAVAMLAVAAVAFGAVTVWLYGDAAAAIWAGDTATDQLERRAYVGSVAGVVTVSSLVFALLLVLRQTTMRALKPVTAPVR